MGGTEKNTVTPAILHVRLLRHSYQCCRRVLIETIILFLAMSKSQIIHNVSADYGMLLNDGELVADADFADTMFRPVNFHDRNPGSAPLQSRNALSPHTR